MRLFAALAVPLFIRRWVNRIPCLYGKHRGWATNIREFWCTYCPHREPWNGPTEVYR